VSTAGRLPDSHRAIPNHAAANAAENTQLSHRAFDWNATCLMLLSISFSIEEELGRAREVAPVLALFACAPADQC